MKFLLAGCCTFGWRDLITQTLYLHHGQLGEEQHVSAQLPDHSTLKHLKFKIFGQVRLAIVERDVRLSKLIILVKTGSSVLWSHVEIHNGVCYLGHWDRFCHLGSQDRVIWVVGMAHC